MTQPRHKLRAKPALDLLPHVDMILVKQPAHFLFSRAHLDIDLCHHLMRIDHKLLRRALIEILITLRRLIK
jgi:hypothetical protein